MAGTLPAYVHDSFGRNSRPSSPARQPITVDIWLDSLGLVEYLPLFSQYRFVQVGVAELLTFLPSAVDKAFEIFHVNDTYNIVKKN